jgi:hypothetical protein
MMIAAVVVFGSRIFNNLAVLRRLIIEHWRDGRSGPQASTRLAEASAGSSAVDARS